MDIRRIRWALALPSVGFEADSSGLSYVTGALFGVTADEWLDFVL
eukprot:CAMPEP_0195609562 /NCGR_PEP_ID=MMETSP0815-20121206/9350_1 /TAXON_ID=97485 /ORGANISM="Prymnesium parvum, Strain Texoma1" /LENGTH=44 /DNA_ID= /DNA_START= /DNA_END= /DNA_ORIENTATION=